MKRRLVGKDEEKKDENAPATPEGPYKETLRGLRWVSITGVLDYKKLRENYEAALKKPEVAYPHFKGLALKRQARDSDGNWSEWEDVDSERNLEILNNLPEEDEELTLDTARIDAIVDPLPFLRAGYWE